MAVECSPRILAVFVSSMGPDAKLVWSDAEAGRWVLEWPVGEGAVLDVVNEAATVLVESGEDWKIAAVDGEEAEESETDLITLLGQLPENGVYYRLAVRPGGAAHGDASTAREWYPPPDTDRTAPNPGGGVACP